MFSSFKDEPDDQESFVFADDSETETNTTARMFSMAVVDGESCHTHSQCHIKVLYPLELTFLLKSMNTFYSSHLWNTLVSQNKATTYY